MVESSKNRSFIEVWKSSTFHPAHLPYVSNHSIQSLVENCGLPFSKNVLTQTQSNLIVNEMGFCKKTSFSKMQSRKLANFTNYRVWHLKWHWCHSSFVEHNLHVHMCACDPVLKSNNKVYLTFMTRDGADNATTHPKLLWYINVNSQAYYHGHNLLNPTPNGDLHNLSSTYVFHDRRRPVFKKMGLINVAPLGKCQSTPVDKYSLIWV